MNTLKRGKIIANTDLINGFIVLTQKYIENRFGENLTPEQVEAVVTAEGLVLILAGVGSGKTTVNAIQDIAAGSDSSTRACLKNRQSRLEE